MFDFKVDLEGVITVNVVAKSKEEAERILNDTVDRITVGDVKKLFFNNEDIKVRYVNMNSKVKENIKDKGVER